MLGALAAAVVFIWHPPGATAPVAATTATPGIAAHHGRAPGSASHRPSDMPAVVYVAGAVHRPGLYRLAAGARADDAVRSASGFRSDADTGAINLAAHVADGDEVYVAVLGAPTPRTVSARRLHAKSNKSANIVVDLNTATAEQLARVPGIGVTLAARVVDVRERDGAYTTFDELLDVAGMTASRLERAQPYLRI